MSDGRTSPGGGLLGAVATYTAARLGLLAAIAAGLVLLDVPLLVALLVAIVLSLSLSFVLFRGLRTRLNAEIAAARARRVAERARLRASLRGEPADDGSATPVHRTFEEGSSAEK